MLIIKFCHLFRYLKIFVINFWKKQVGFRRKEKCRSDEKDEPEVRTS